ncbi:MAG: serine/threonine-protein kinase [Kofleriaceae bacterium]
MANEADTRTRLAPGDRVLDRYEVAEAIASGGHSTVYRGHDTRLARPVCIKVFSPLADLETGDGDTGAARTSYQHFVQEAFALSRLTHPNTLRIYDFGHLDGHAPSGVAVPVQVSEFCGGGTVTDLVRVEGAQPLEQLARIIVPMCEALGEAHALGLVHRDIKPQNLLFTLVGASRQPKLCDFGIAKWGGEAAEPGQRADDTQLVAGRRLAMYSPSWAAPEQMAGELAGPAADQYSLALVTVFLATGLVLFADADLYESYRRRRHGAELARAALEEAGLPARVIDALAQALALAPTARHDGVDALAAALGGVVAEASPAASDVVAAPLAAGTAVSAEVDSAVWLSGPPAPWRVAEHHAGASIAGRELRFAALTDGVADLDLGGGATLRVTSQPGAGGRPQWHLRARGAFIAPAGGRPSSAIQLDADGAFELVTPQRIALGAGHLSLGVATASDRTFPLGDQRVAVDGPTHGGVATWALIDMGPGRAAYVLFSPAPGASATRPAPRRTPRGAR